jgi:hypothetical protein
MIKQLAWVVRSSTYVSEPDGRTLPVASASDDAGTIGCRETCGRNEHPRIGTRTAHESHMGSALQRTHLVHRTRVGRFGRSELLL